MTVRRAMQPGGSLSLQDFIRRAQVLGLYRSFMRYGRRVERADLREEVLKQVKVQFRTHRAMPRETVSTLLVEGQRQLQLLKSMAGPPPRGRTHGQQQQEESGGVKGWLEAGDPEEERGKVGQGWPWEQQQDDDDQGSNKPR